MTAYFIIFILALGGGVASVRSIILRRATARGWALTTTSAILSVAYNPSVPSNVSDLSLGLSVALLSISLLERRQRVARTTPWRLTAIWYAIFLVVTIAVLPSNGPALAKLGTLACLLVVVASRCQEADYKILSTGLVSLALVHSLIGIAEFFTKRPPLWGYGSYADGSLVTLVNPFLGEDTTRIQGTLGHPIPFGVVIGIGLILVIFQRSAFKRSSLIICVLVFTITLFLNGSRSVIICLFISLFCHLILTFRYRAMYKNILFMFSCFLTICILYADASKLVLDLINSGSYTNRVEALGSMPGLLARPTDQVLWGSGFGSEHMLFANGYLQQNGFNIVDNQLVTTLATFGIFGLSILLISITAGFVTGDHMQRIGIVFMAAMMFSFDYLRWPETFVYFYMLIGLAARCRKRPTVSNFESYVIKNRIR